MPLSQLLCSKVGNSRNNTKSWPKRLHPHPPVLPEGLSGVWELDVVIFICLYPNFFLWAVRQVNEASWMQLQGTKEGRSTYKELLLALGVAFKDCIT